MRSFKTALFCFMFLVISCKETKENETRQISVAQDPPAVDVHGHRGDRGNFPENTIPAFLSAVRKGVGVLEMDVVISKDKQVVVSHEPYMSALFMLTPSGDSIKKEEEQTYNLYKMRYDSIRKFDAGSKGNKLFPEQQKVQTFKPLLADVIDSVQNLIEREQLSQVKFSIELKSKPSHYGISQPYPEEFVELVMYVFREKNIMNKAIIQSFDPAILNILKNNHPSIEIAFLVEEEGIKDQLKRLDFKPEIYSPHYELVENKQFVDSVRYRGMKLVPWTINNEQEIEKMIELGVDGIITDYPERVLQKLKSGK